MLLTSSTAGGKRNNCGSNPFAPSQTHLRRYMLSLVTPNHHVSIAFRRSTRSHFTSYCEYHWYNLSKYLAGFLKPLINTTVFFILNSHYLIQRPSNLMLSLDNLFVRFDVESFFTNVPIPYSLALIEEILNSNKKTTDLLQLIEFCLSSTYFLCIQK